MDRRTGGGGGGDVALGALIREGLGVYYHVFHNAYTGEECTFS